MKLREFEHIEHKKIGYLKVFLVQIQNTTPHHWHSDIEVFLILDGSFLLNVSGQTNSLHSGDMVILNSYEPHRIERSGGKGLLLAVQYSPKFCTSFFPAMEHISFLQTVLPTGDTYKKELDILLSLAFRFFQEDFSFSLDCIGLLSLFNAQLIRNTAYRIMNQSEQISREYHIRRVKHMLDYIGAHYTQKLLLSDVAQYENLSMNYLSHFFTEQLGITFQDYIKQLRFEKALELITKTDSSLIDICISCGFSDGRYLNRVFYQYFGCTPSEYRRHSKDNSSINLVPYYLNTTNPNEKTISDSLELLNTYYPQNQ